MVGTSQSMEMRVMCNVSNDAPVGRNGWFWRWFRERVVTGFWWLVPLGFSISRAGGRRDWFVRTLVALFTLIALRLWDDIEDVAHDRSRHPGRILCQMDTSAVYVPCIAGLVMASSLVLVVGNAIHVFVMVLPLLYGASRWRTRSSADLRVVWAQVILLKIPALLIALASGAEASGHVWGRGLGLYGFVGGYEVLHDQDLRRSRWATYFLGLNIFCFVVGLAIATNLP